MATRIARIPLLGITALAIAACGDVGPAGLTQQGFDAPALNANLQALDHVLQGGLWESFRALGPQFTAGGSVAALGAALAEATTPEASVDAARAAALRLARGLLAAGKSPTLVPRLPLEIRGTTFVLDPATLQYVPDPERAGAPANGVRFILYAVNPVTHGPVLDLEVGYADLTDEGDSLPDRIALRLRVVSGGVAYLDYMVTAGGSETVGSLTAAGFTTDGIRRIEFRVGVSAADDGDAAAVQVQFEIAMPDRAFHATATVRNVDAASGAFGEVALEVMLGETQIIFTAHGTADTIAAEFRVNGALFATARGDPRAPEIRGADGRELTPEEQRALHGIIELVGRVFEMFNVLMQPVGAMLGVGA